MARAVVDGTKTQTRRHVYTLQKARPGLAIDSRYPEPRGMTAAGWPDTPVGYGWGLNRWQHLAVGHRLWGKETHACESIGGATRDFIHYRATPSSGRFLTHVAITGAQTWRNGVIPLYEWRGKWTPSIHMPRWACRLVLDVVDLRVERLQQISEADALAEGVVKVGSRWEVPGIVATPISARDAYKALWEFINGRGSWNENPWVRVISFKRASE